MAAPAGPILLGQRPDRRTTPLPNLPRATQRNRPMPWTPDAEAKLKEVPFFVRPAVRRRIEGLALEVGRSSVDLAFYEAAKARFGQT